VAVRPVVHFPHDALKAVASPVEEIDDGVHALVNDLLETMRAWSHCVGLAANQIGVARRVAVVDVTGHRAARSCSGELVLINPTLLEAEDPLTAREGCMSVPDLTGEVTRAQRIVVGALGLDGAPFTIDADAIEARALLHEIDHLDGRLFLDRVASHAAVFRRKTRR
jgi:peptide deformylase